MPDDSYIGNLLKTSYIFSKPENSVDLHKPLRGGGFGIDGVVRFSGNRVLRSNNEIFPEKLSVFAKPFVLCTIMHEYNNGMIAYVDSFDPPFLTLIDSSVIPVERLSTMYDYYSGDAWGESVYFDIDMLYSITQGNL